MGAPGKFSCEGCGKSYAWKSELAGKRVKCKCGQPLTVPREDPAAAEADFGGFDDFEALANGTPVDAYAAAPVSSAGPTCPSCGGGVTPGAVLCMNCGYNLKTGKKVKTQKVAGGVGGGGAVTPPMYDNSRFAVKSIEGEGASKNNKIIAIACVAVVVLLIGGVVAIKVIDPQGNKERQKRLDAQQPEMEKLLENMDKSGGLVGAMKDGTLLDGVPRNNVPTTAHIDLNHQGRLQNRCEQLYQTDGNQPAKEWLAANPKAEIRGWGHDKSIKMIDELEAMGATKVMALQAVEIANGVIQAFGVVATLPEDKARRAKIFKWYHSLERVIEDREMPEVREVGQKYISVEIREE